MAKARVRASSRNSAEIEPFVLRPGQQTRLVFKPQMVNNSNDRQKPVRGRLVWQKRAPSDVDAEWVDEDDLDLRTMEPGSGVKLSLSTDELHMLTLVVRGLYGLFWDKKHKLPKDGAEIDLDRYARYARDRDADWEDVLKLIEAVGREPVVQLIRSLAQEENASAAVTTLAELDFADLTRLHSLAGVQVLRKALDTWESNRENPSEAFWQETLREYSFVLSQVFAKPVVYFGEKAYVGGKGPDNKGGKQPDFLLQSEQTGHVLLVEIKTPHTSILKPQPYREPNVYAVSDEVNGAVAQAAAYKDGLAKHYLSLREATPREFAVAEPQCVVIVGDSASLDSRAKKDSFELFRRGLRHIEVITFDELFTKGRTLVKLLEGGEGP